MKNKGVSLISLIITIIAIIILATIAIYNGYKTPDMAIYTGFSSDIDEIRTEIRNY